MKTSNQVEVSAPFNRLFYRGLCIAGFQAISPRFRTPQSALQDWLTEAHVNAGGPAPESMRNLFSRYSASADRIAYRGHELSDFTHRRWEEMRLFGPAGSDLAQKTKFFDECVLSVFERLYPAESPAPDAIVHVTCTGYSAPSGAQRLVSSRGWSKRTRVLHAYHMGCYAAHPAIQIAAGQLTVSKNPNLTVDVVHTELCSLHLNPVNHDPSQLVIQSLFADGFMKYRVTGADKSQGLEILAIRDEMVPDSEQAMRWVTGPLTFTMELSKEVPTLFASALPGFVHRLFVEADLELSAEKTKAVFAVHPGGPRIIELAQHILGLDPAQVAWSRHVLHEHGNMSSATLPHIWQGILQDKLVPDGTLIASLGAGPGLTLSGILFRKRTTQGTRL